MSFDCRKDAPEPSARERERNAGNGQTGKPWPTTFAEAFDPRNNSFGFLRFFLAATVVYAHCFRLGRIGTEPVMHFFGYDVGGLAVSAFFVLSGFLITRSFQGTNSLVRFLWHRALRILPGYWVCLVVAALFLGPLGWLLEYGNLSDYFRIRDRGPFGFILNNALVSLRQLRIAGLFAGNPVPEIVDGSLWSLAFEMKCYFAVGALGFIGLSRSRVTVAGLFLASWGMYVADTMFPGMDASFRWKPIGALTVLVGMYFAGGATYFLFRDVIPFRRRYLCIACAVLLVGLQARCFDFVAPFALPYILLWAACRLPLQRFDRNGDYSYGIYIYSSPLQQILVLVGADRLGFAPFLALSLIATAPLAYLSFRYVEEPCLRLKNWSWRGASRRVALTPLVSKTLATLGAAAVTEQRSTRSVRVTSASPAETRG